MIVEIFISYLLIHYNNFSMNNDKNFSLKFSIILIEPLYEGNIGSVARVMKNFGFENLILVNPCKIGMEAIKMAKHGIDILQNAKTLNNFDELRENFDFLIGTSAKVAGDKNFVRTPLNPSQLIEILEKRKDENFSIGVVFGREDRGLKNEEIEKCDFLLNIPTLNEYSLNLSHAVAIIAYELSKLFFKERKLRKLESATKLEKEILLEKFSELVTNVGLRDFRKRLAIKTFKEVISRGLISGRECATLTGIFRKANEKIKNN